MATALPAVNRDHVFINCPFDKRYKPLFDAAIFTVHELGFQARHALIGRGEAVRLRRIATELAGSKYSIHDLSRIQLSGPNRLPRFNMPFEAGMAYFLHQFAPAGEDHHILLLDAVSYQSQASTSDVAGLDPKIHSNDPHRVVQCVRSFLVPPGPAGRRKPGADHVWDRYQAFQRALKTAATVQRLSLRELKDWSYANDLQSLMAEWIADNPA
jgi:hypothetical protein